MGNLLLRAKNGLWGVVSRGYVCVWGADVELAKKKNLLPRVKNSLWGVVSRGYVCVWGVDVELAKKKKSAPQSQK